jgi:hypothetical protein
MGGIFVDVFVSYVYRSVSRRFRARNGATWPSLVAEVKSSTSFRGGFGCAAAMIVYTYVIDEHTFAGANEVPFISPSSAETYASNFPAGSNVIVRIDPQDPNKSIMRDTDQVKVTCSPSSAQNRI